MLWYAISLTYYSPVDTVPGQRIQAVGISVESELYGRALRSVPGSGEVWARYIRFLVGVTGSLTCGILNA